MKPNKPQSELWTALTELKPFLRRAIWFSVASSLLVLMPSAYMLEVYDRVVNSRSHMTLAMLTLLLLASLALMEVLEWVRSEVMREGSVSFDRRLSGRVFAATFEASLRRIPGGATQPMNDLRTVRDFLCSPVVFAVMETPVALVILVLLFAISPVLGWVSLVAALVQVFVGWRNELSTRPPLMAANRAAAGAQQYAESSLRNAQVIESMGMLGAVHRRWMAKQKELILLQAKASEAAGYYQAISKFIQNTVSSMLLGLGAWLLLRNQLAGGGAYMIIASILGGRALAPLVQIVAQWQSVVNVRDAYRRLDRLLSEIPEREPSMPLPAPKGALQVEGLHAGAPGSQQAILKGVSFALAPGEVLVVIGPSASGKTTLARLLVGLWPSMGGKVRLDGADVFQWDKNQLGQHLGYLPQGVELFEGTIADNIARFGEVDQAQVERAANAVGLHEYILSLPDAYASPVGRDGAILSGGRRQRIALARALYGRPAFVVLDEPNSSLDEQGDAALAHAIRTLKSQGVTFVIMTHRSSVLSVADKVLFLRDGQVQLFGPRDEVMKAMAEATAKARQGGAPVPVGA